mmetsp:Transcript_24689/g.46107  ORF Transcript_24689/g.46107 Transcript_24689/m.46107 type:complete len:530 (-) Transcript_24689:345-1934(-)
MKATSSSLFFFLFTSSLSATANGATDYVHIDISDRFSQIDKISVTVLYALVMASLTYLGLSAKTTTTTTTSATCNRCRESRLVALLGSWCMVLLRKFISSSKDNEPRFDIGRSVLIEPMVFLWASMLLSSLLHLGNDNSKTTFRTTFFRSALWISTLTCGEDDEQEQPTPVSPWIHLARTMGSSLFMSGSVSAMTVAVKAYDDISFTTFAMDMALPVGISTMFGAFAIVLYQGCRPLATRNDSGASTDSTSYSVIALQEMTSMEVESTQTQVEEDAMSIKADTISKVEPTLSENTDSGTASQDDSWFLRIVNHEESVCLIVLVVLFILNRGMILTLISLTVVLAVWKVALYFFHSTYNFGKPIPSTAVTMEQIYDTIVTLDYGCLLWYVCLMILTSGWTDTGVPQKLIYWILGHCADQIGEGWCQTQSSLLFFSISAIVSPLPTLLVFGDMFPYAAPYHWVQLAFAVALGRSLCVLSGESLFFWSNGQRAFPFLVQLVTCLVALFLGSILLQMFHSSYECSERLGECVR